jgi:hypothetical protein
MDAPGFPQLPPEVLDRLAASDRVRVQVGRLGSQQVLPAVFVPLRERSYVLFRPTWDALDELERSVVSSVLADAPDGAWSVLARGRLLWGRPVHADRRRAELAHWVPEGSGGWIACRFYAEHLDYQVDRPGGRQRSAGPVPGAVAPSWLRQNLALGYEPFQVWFLVSAALVAAGILVMDAEEAGTPLVLVTALVAGQLTIVAGRVLLAAVDLRRWRESRAGERTLGPLIAAWRSPAELTGDGLRLAAGAAVAWVVLLLLAGVPVTVLVSFLSGAPVILLAMAMRRRIDEPKEEEDL